MNMKDKHFIIIDTIEMERALKTNDFGLNIPNAGLYSQRSIKWMR